MKKNSGKRYGTDYIFTLFVLLLFVASVWLGGRLARMRMAGREVRQTVIVLSDIGCRDMEQYERLLEDIAKIPGIRSVTPVIEIPVMLRAGDYEMEACLQGVDLSKLAMKGKADAELPAGRTPVLLLGENSIRSMRDANGQELSEKRRKELLSRYSETKWQYYLLRQDNAGESGGADDWMPCLVAGVLSSPADEIYLSYEQAAYFAGMRYDPMPVKKILVTYSNKTHIDISERIRLQ